MISHFGQLGKNVSKNFWWRKWYKQETTFQGHSNKADFEMTRAAVSLTWLCRATTIVILCFHWFQGPSLKTVNTTVEKTEQPSTFPFEHEMIKLNLTRSLRQQKKFHRMKDLVHESFPQEMLYVAKTGKWHSVVLNKQYAYRHIFKNGGTTVEKQVSHRAIPKYRIKNKTLIATVRDPLDHFLSGWQECGKRYKKEMGWKMPVESYDKRIRTWLNTTIEMGHGTSCKRRLSCLCAIHSLPQSNFLLTNDGVIDPQVRIVGDLSELRGFLALVGVRYQDAKGDGRDASLDSFKNTYFPRKAHLISNSTMRNLCEFLKVDYFLFDFEKPEACRNDDFI
eukprot:scaffold1739_cov109-Cylindrotheca_fusiformis.AAC.6